MCTGAIPETTMFAEGAFAPSIIDNYGFSDRALIVEPAKKESGVPIPRRRFPIPIAPYHFWFIRCYNFLQLWHSLAGNKIIGLEAVCLVLKVIGERG